VQLIDQQLGGSPHDGCLRFVDDEHARDAPPVLCLECIGHRVAIGRIAPDPEAFFDASETTAHRAPEDLAALVCGDQHANARQEAIVGSGVNSVEGDDAHRDVLGELEPLLLVAGEAVEGVRDDHFHLASETGCSELVELGARASRAGDPAVVVHADKLPALTLDLFAAPQLLHLRRGAVLLP
jgi:hypothetical protein